MPPVDGNSAAVYLCTALAVLRKPICSSFARRESAPMPSIAAAVSSLQSTGSPFKAGLQQL
eukprot:364571-Chlamydomonas_euryale.AAC.5